MYQLISQSVSQFSHSVVSDSLRPHELHHARPPCPSPTPGVHPNPCPLCRWCHPTISSSVVPFSSCPQSFPASGFFSNESALRIRWSKYWSFSFSISPSKEYSGLISFLLTSLISLQSKGLSDSLLQLHSSKASVLRCAVFFKIHLSHPYIQLSSVAQSCPTHMIPRNCSTPAHPSMTTGKP